MKQSPATPAMEKLWLYKEGTSADPVGWSFELGKCLLVPASRASAKREVGFPTDLRRSGLPSCIF